MRAVCLLAPLKLSQAQSGSIFQRAGFPPSCHSMFQTEQLSTELRGVCPKSHVSRLHTFAGRPGILGLRQG